MLKGLDGSEEVRLWLSDRSSATLHAATLVAKAGKGQVCCRAPRSAWSLGITYMGPSAPLYGSPEINQTSSLVRPGLGAMLLIGSHAPM
jgi:hypothetical protein